MAVLIEAISVVVRADRILSKFPGSWEAFKRIVPNKTLCSDNELVRVGFMTPDDTRAFVGVLVNHGLTYVEDSRAADLVVVDQRQGFIVPCDWAEFGHIHWQGNPSTPVAACRLVESKESSLFTPDGWEYPNSLSSRHEFVESNQVQDRLEFVRQENGVDVYRDLETGKEVYVGRTSG